MDKQKIPPSPGPGVKEFLKLFLFGGGVISIIYLDANEFWSATLLILLLILHQLQGFLKNNKMKNIMTIVIIIIIMIGCGLMMWESRNGFS